MAKLRLKKGVNINRVVVKVVATIIALYVGGTILIELGNVMLHTESPFYKGLTLVGWTVGGSPLYNATNYATTCANTTVGTTSAVGSNCITDTSGSGVLAVIGIVGIASIVTEFVEFSM